MDSILAAVAALADKPHISVPERVQLGVDKVAVAEVEERMPGSDRKGLRNTAVLAGVGETEGHMTERTLRIREELRNRVLL